MIGHNNSWDFNNFKVTIQNYQKDDQGEVEPQNDAAGIFGYLIAAIVSIVLLIYILGLLVNYCRSKMIGRNEASKKSDNTPDDIL